MAFSLLLVEDDTAIGEPLERALRREGFEVTWVTTGAGALDATDDTLPDLVLLDLTLPDMDGLDVCRALRARSVALPIVMCTARAEEIDVVVGFEAGADDYVTKPFSLAELRARLRARLRLARDASSGPAAALEANGVRLDADAHRAWHGDEEIELTPKEFDLLSLLVQEAGRVVPRMRIMREVWDENYVGSTRTLDMHISWLRRKLRDDPDTPTLITTVRGVGFRFEPGA